MPDLIDLADAVLARIRASTTGEAKVSREYVVARQAADLELAEREVFVFPVGDGDEDGGPVSRGRDSELLTVRVVVAERYTAQATRVPSEWMDARVRWVRDKIKAALTDPRGRTDEAYPEARQTVVFSEELYAEERIFWSETEVTYRAEDD